MATTKVKQFVSWRRVECFLEFDLMVNSHPRVHGNKYTSIAKRAVNVEITEFLDEGNNVMGTVLAGPWFKTIAVELKRMFNSEEVINRLAESKEAKIGGKYNTAMFNADHFHLWTRWNGKMMKPVADRVFYWNSAKPTVTDRTLAAWVKKIVGLTYSLKKYLAVESAMAEKQNA